MQPTKKKKKKVVKAYCVHDKTGIDVIHPYPDEGIMAIFRHKDQAIKFNKNHDDFQKVTPCTITYDA